MTKLLFLGTAWLVFAMSSASPLIAKDNPKPAATEKSARKGKLQHVVSFKFKDSATKEQVREIEEAFRTLKTKIPQIDKLQWGLNNSPEGLNKGFTHCWILTFGSEADRDAYLKHPDHVEFGKLLRPVLGDVFVIDFWAKD
jgi:Stress responsive A/B Barrel Domain